MKRIYLILSINVIFSIVIIGQNIEINKNKSGVVTMVRFCDSTLNKTLKSLNIIELNPFKGKYSRFKDTCLINSNIYFVDEEIFLNEIIPKSKRKLYNDEFKSVSPIVNEISLLNPVISCSNNTKYLGLIYNQLLYSNKSIVGSNSSIQIYNSIGELIIDMEFESSVSSYAISDDCNFLSLSYKIAGPDNILINPGFTLLNLQNQKVIFQKSFPKNSLNPTTSSINNILVSATTNAIGNNCFFIFNPETKLLYEMETPKTKGNLEVTAYELIYSDLITGNEIKRYAYYDAQKITKIN